MGDTSLLRLCCAVPQHEHFRKALEQEGIATGIHYPTPIHLQSACTQYGYRRGMLPVTEAACERIVSLPMYAEMTEQQARTVRQVRKQVQPVAFEPAIKGTVVDALEGKQDANCDNLTGIQVGVLALVDVRQFIVYHAKESNDNLFGSHRVV